MTLLLLILGGAAYLGIGAFYATKWFHHKTVASVVIVTLLWPLILFLSLLTK